MERDKNTLREEFKGIETLVRLKNGKMIKGINFDNAATTPPFTEVLEKINKLSDYYASIGRGTGQKAAISTEIYESSRNFLLDFFNVQDKGKYTTIFVNNTTDGINRIANTLICDKGVVLSTRMEHHSNDLPWRKNAFVDYVEVDSLGRLDYNSLNEKLEKYKGNLRFLTIAGASNTTGYLNDIHKIAKLTHEAGGKIVVDGAQLVPHTKVNISGNKPGEEIDFLVFSGHKLYAPFGSGVIIGLKEEFNNSCPDKQGGGIVEIVKDWEVKYLETPERNEAGTPNFFGVIALVEALKKIDKIGYDVLLQHEKDLLKKLLDGLKSIKNIKNYGDIVNIDDRLGIATFNIENIYHRDVAKALAENRGISVRHGWFCAHPYCRRLMGLTESEATLFTIDKSAKMPGMVRASIGPYNTIDEIEIFLNEVESISKNKFYV